MNATERRYFWYAVAFATVAILWLCGACARLPQELRVHGRLTAVERKPEYEAPCGFVTRMRDPLVCERPPVCCSYELTLEDSSGHHTYFLAFWPRYAEGLHQGEEITAHLRRREIYRLPCFYACLYDVALAVDDDVDIAR